jgi:hypothetical protein
VTTATPSGGYRPPFLSQASFVDPKAPTQQDSTVKSKKQQLNPIVAPIMLFTAYPDLL